MSHLFLAGQRGGQGDLNIGQFRFGIAGTERRAKGGGQGLRRDGEFRTARGIADDLPQPDCHRCAAQHINRLHPAVRGQIRKYRSAQGQKPADFVHLFLFTSAGRGAVVEQFAQHRNLGVEGAQVLKFLGLPDQCRKAQPLRVFIVVGAVGACKATQCFPQLAVIGVGGDFDGDQRTGRALALGIQRCDPQLHGTDPRLHERRYRQPDRAGQFFRTVLVHLSGLDEFPLGGHQRDFGQANVVLRLVRERDDFVGEKRPVAGIIGDHHHGQ